MLTDYNVKYVASFSEPRVLPVDYSEVLTDIIKKMLKYYKSKPDCFSQYAVLDEKVNSRKKNCNLERTHHLLHAPDFSSKNWEKKIKANNSKLDKMLSKYGNKFSLNRFNSFETGITIGDYMEGYDIEEITAGCSAKYVFSQGLMIPSFFVETRSLGRKRKEANKFCRDVIKKAKEKLNLEHVTVYENIEKG